MLGIVVSRADSASVHIGEQLLELADWERHEDKTQPSGEGRTVYRTEGARLREFDTRHLDMERPAEAFDEPTLLIFASRHAGETGQLLTAHHTGNVGPADHGGRPNELARACPNAHHHVIRALDEFAPDGYAVGMECTHHGPSDVGAPSMFVEVGSSEAQWQDPDAARAVARAILSVRTVEPDSPCEPSDESERDGKTNHSRHHLVGLGGGHYAPRFERIVRETDWSVGHILADWGLEALRADEKKADHTESLAGVLEQAFAESRAAYALVDGDRPELESAVVDLGYRAVTETWVRETDGLSLELVRELEREVSTVDDGLRFGEQAAATDSRNPKGWTLTAIGDVLDEAFGIDRDATRAAVTARAIAFETGEGGTRPTGRLVLESERERERIIERLLGVLETRYDSVERRDGTVIATEEAFEPELARTLGIPEGPAFGQLANGQSVEVNGEMIPPEAVRRTRERVFSLE